MRNGLWAASVIVALGAGFLLGALLYPRGEGSLGGIDRDNDPPSGEEMPSEARPPEGVPEDTDPRDATIAVLRAEVARLKREPKTSRTPPEPDHDRGAGPERAAPAGPARDPEPGVLDPPLSRALGEGRGGIEGHITDGDGKPIPGLRITVEDDEEEQGYTLRPDSSGLFRLPDLKPGYYYLHVQKNGMVASKWPNKSVDVEAGEFARVDFGGQDSVSVSGRVCDGGGRSVHDVGIGLSGSDRNGVHATYSASADAHGRFSMSFVDPGKYRWEVVDFNRNVVGSGTKVIPAGEPCRWDITLCSTEVSGTIVDSRTGTSVIRAKVILWPVGRRGGRMRSQSVRNGIFRFRGLQPGTYQMRVYSKFFAYTMGPKVDVEEGKSVKGLRVVLDRAVTVQVRVRDGDGRPVKTFDVHWYLGATHANYWITRETKDGTVEVDDIGPGTYTLVVSAEGYRDGSRKDVRLSYGANPAIDVVLERAE